MFDWIKLIIPNPYVFSGLSLLPTVNLEPNTGLIVMMVHLAVENGARCSGG